jgi:uncharacterized membrane protein
MNGLRDYLTGHWFSLLLLAVALALGAALLLVRRRRNAWSLPLMLLGSAFALLGIGGLVLPFDIALWIGAIALSALFVMLLIVITTGAWWAPLGFGVGALLLFGLGGVCGETFSEGLTETGKLALSLEPTQPWWLLLLLLIPLVVYLSYRSLAGLGPVRRWVAIGLRSLLILLLTLALAEVRLRHQNENITVLFLVDRSLSIPEDYGPEKPGSSARIDRRWDRIEKFINETVAQRGPEHKYDRAGLILFGKRPRLELPPSNAPSFNFHFKDAASNIDGNYTDIAAAIKLALASFPEGTGKRIILLSDGNENLGNAEEQARVAKLNGAQIDAVPLAADYHNENEVLVQSVEAPPRTEQGARLPIRVLLRSYNPRTVYGTLVLKQITEGESVPVAPSPMHVKLRPGLNPFSFKQPLTSQQQSYTYQAIFQPEAVENERGELVQGLAGDRVQNNSATTHVVALGQRRILVIEQDGAEHHHKLLIDRLTLVGNAKYKVYAIAASRLPENKTELGIFLSNYDCVIMADVPAELFNDEQQEMIRSNTQDQGCGLIVIGGPDSYGAGGWQGTPVEKALPVDCDIKSYKVQGKGGLVLIMHASEMSDGNRWQKEIAKLAIKKLSPMDEVGILHYDWGVHKWHIPLQEIRTKRNSLLAQVDRMTPGDMPDFDQPLKMAYEALTEKRRQLATKHVIIISDGDPGQNNQSVLRNMKRDKVTVTTVGVATHGAPQDQALKRISDSTGGRFYKVTSARALPAIYIKETRIVSQSFVYENRFQPRLLFKSGPTDKLPDPLPPLYGFVRTTAKQSPLVEIPIVGLPGPDQDFPILAHWTYGLGKAVAFTSDARSAPGKPRWDRDWASSDMYAKFWEQVVDWALRPTETGKWALTTEVNDGKVKVIVDARDGNNRPLTDLNIQGGITTPNPKAEDSKRPQLKFEQKNSGLYEAEFKAEEAGSYFISVQGRRKVKVMENGKEVEKEEADSIRSGVTIPYSPEFADMESNPALLSRLRDMTGGTNIPEDELAKAADETDPSAEAARSALAREVFRSGLPQFKNLQPVWYWLVFFAGVGLFFDVATRRIAIQPEEAWNAADRFWSRLRGRAPTAEQTPQFMDRLQSRKAQVSETLKAARRFEAGERPADAPAGAEEAATGTTPLNPPIPKPPIAPEKEQEGTDYASRLLKAKKRVWQDREKEPPE